MAREEGDGFRQSFIAALLMSPPLSVILNEVKNPVRRLHQCYRGEWPAGRSIDRWERTESVRTGREPYRLWLGNFDALRMNAPTLSF